MLDVTFYCTLQVADCTKQFVQQRYLWHMVSLSSNFLMSKFCLCKKEPRIKCPYFPLKQKTRLWAINILKYNNTWCVYFLLYEKFVNKIQSLICFSCLIFICLFLNTVKTSCGTFLHKWNNILHALSTFCIIHVNIPWRTDCRCST